MIIQHFVSFTDKFPMKIFAIFILLFLTITPNAQAQGQLGGSGGEMSPEEKVKVTKEQTKEFGELDQLSKKLIVLTKKRIKHCNHVKVEIKNLEDLIIQLAGHSFKLLPGQKSVDLKNLHCSGTPESQRDTIYHCLMKKGPKKVLRHMLKNKAILVYFRVRMDLSEREAEEAIRFLGSLSE
jgi:hypothetical protein